MDLMCISAWRTLPRRWQVATCKISPHPSPRLALRSVKSTGSLRCNCSRAGNLR